MAVVSVIIAVYLVLLGSTLASGQTTARGNAEGRTG